MKILNIFGVSSTCYNACLTSIKVEESHIVTLPLNTIIVKWNILTGERSTIIQAHNDEITNIQRSPTNPNLIATTSFAGDVSLWNEKWELLSSLRVNRDKLSHAAFSPDGSQLATFSRGDEGVCTILNVSNSTLSIAAELKGHYEFGCINEDGSVFCVEQDCMNPYSSVNFMLFKKNDDVFTKVKQIEINKNGPVVKVIHTCGNLAAIALMNRTIFIVDTTLLDIKYTFNAIGSGNIKVMIFEKDILYIPSDNGKCHLYHIKDKPVMIKEAKIPNATIYYMGFAKKKEERVWVMTDSALYYYKLDSNPHDEKINPSIQFHSLTCCGIDISPNGNSVATGDFGCNVHIWELDNSYKPKKSIKIGMPVRSLCWRKENFIQIGCLDGIVYQWDLKKDSIERLFAFKEGVTCMALQNGDDPRLLACGTVDGTLAILEQLPGEDFFRIKLAFVAHKPIKDNKNENFGSIHKFAEIWSLCWSPDNQFIATTSEDQTTIIWNLNGEKIQTLRGHTTAVTSVDWKKTKNLGEILVTCADDRSLRVYTKKENQFELYHVFKTCKNLDWHTLTYLALNEDGTKVASGTQHGYIYVWDLVEKKVEHKYKLHSGSIEGIKWKGIIASCGSDCTVNVYEI